MQYKTELFNDIYEAVAVCWCLLVSSAGVDYKLRRKVNYIWLHMCQQHVVQSLQHTE